MWWPLVACNNGSSSNTAVIGCADGASQCGASSSATQYSVSITGTPEGKLTSANDLIISNDTPLTLSFSAESITTPVTITFTASAGTLSEPIHTFNPSDAASMIFTPTFTPGSSSDYTITPSVGGTKMAPITITTMSPTTVGFPTRGTWTFTGSGVIDNYLTCSFGTFDKSMTVMTDAGIYICNSYDQSGAEEPSCEYNGTIPNTTFDFTLPTIVDFFTAGIGFNGSYKNNTVTYNVYSDLPGCTGYIDTWNIKYSSSQSLPYPIVDGVSSKNLKNKHLPTMFNSK